MTEAGNPPKTKTGGFPASLESAIPPRFPHSHRPCGCYIGFKIQGPKAKPERRSLSSAPVPFPFRLILQLEKTAPGAECGIDNAPLSGLAPERTCRHRRHGVQLSTQSLRSVLMLLHAVPGSRLASARGMSILFLPVDLAGRFDAQSKRHA